MPEKGETRRPLTMPVGRRRPGTKRDPPPDPVESRKELGNPVQVKIHASIEQALEHSQCLPGKSIARQAVRDQCIIVGPYAAGVIAYRVVSLFRSCYRANAPTGKRLRRQ